MLVNILRYAYAYACSVIIASFDAYTYSGPTQLSNPTIHIHSQEERVKEQERLYSKLGSVLKPYFKKYDANGDGVVDFEEFRVICSEVSQTASRDAQLAIFNRMDTDKNGEFVINLELFVCKF